MRLRPQARRAASRPQRSAKRLPSALRVTNSRPAPTVVIQLEPFGGFEVLAPETAHSREFRKIADARQYAQLIAAEHGWALDDWSGEP